MTNNDLRKWAAESWNYAPSEVEEAILRVLAEHQRMQEALKFYADRNNTEESGPRPHTGWGHKAREVLASLKSDQ